MTRPILVFICLLPTVFLPAGLGAQQPAKIPRIGYLNNSSPSFSATRIEAFRQGLRDLGYVEGKNITIEWRHSEGKTDRLPALAAELVRLKVVNLKAAKQIGLTIPPNVLARANRVIR
jgi:putative ABC transport system substrate-binding protein